MSFPELLFTYTYRDARCAFFVDTQVMLLLSNPLIHYFMSSYSHEGQSEGYDI
jgi:hypothetical protein